MTITTPFLTQLDSRAAIKGSRDPLGVQSIWTRFGRRVVGNLTTVSNSVRDFTVTLLGYYFAERVADEGGTDGDVATFLKWEQLAAYARASVNSEKGFRGTERVARRLAESDRVRLGVSSDAQILANQKIYGLWGLYTIPAKSSGLLEGDPTRLTTAARAVIERVHLPLLSNVASHVDRAIVEKLRERDASLDVRGRTKDARLLDAIAKTIRSVRPTEAVLFREHLLFGGPSDRGPAAGTHGKQRVFAELLAETFAESDWAISPETAAELARRAGKRGAAGEALADDINSIRACELLLAPAVAFFEHVLASDGQTPKQVADTVRQHWGGTLRETIELEAIEALEPAFKAAAPDPDIGARWIPIARALHAAQYDSAVTLLLEQNAAVMNARSAAAGWAVIREGKVQVRFRDEQLGRLPEAVELPTLWRHAYFIDSLRTVAGALRGG